jgi:hypothetical protein
MVSSQAKGSLPNPADQTKKQLGAEEDYLKHKTKLKT